MPRFKAYVSILALAAASVLGTSTAVAADDLSEWKLPPVPVPADNPQSKAKIQLGHQLAFDTRLSRNDSISCAGCHLPFAGGGGNTPRAFGQGGELGRAAPTWVNSGYFETLFWDGRAASLEEQTGALIDAGGNHMGPISSPSEMGGDVPAIVKRLNSIPGYKEQFNAAFGEDATPQNIAKAIASFERTLVANDSPFQRYVSGDKQALSKAAERGFELFKGKAQCEACHSAPLMTNNRFHNIGVPAAGPLTEDLGRYEVNKNDGSRGAFKTPTLYNSASRQFFMHNGALSSIEDVIEHYDRGGNSADKHQSSWITPLNLTDKEKQDLVAFLKSLTDPGLDRISRPNLPRS